MSAGDWGLKDKLLQALGREDRDRLTSNTTLMLSAMAHHGKHVYAGTVPAAVKAHRRAKNRCARAARRLNR